MADPVNEILQDLHAAIDHAAAIAMDRFRAVVSAASIECSPEGAKGELKLISVGAAGHFANLSDDRIRALCRQFPYGSTSAGFGFRIGGRWQVAEDLFKQHLRATTRV